MKKEMTVEILKFNEILLRNPSSLIIAFMKDKNIFYRKSDNGLLIDNYRVMKFFLDREAILEVKGVETVNDDVLWDIADSIEHKEIWSKIEKPIIPTFRDDNTAQRKIIDLYLSRLSLSQKRKKVEFEKNRKIGTKLYNIECSGQVMEYEIVKVMNSMYEIKCLNRKKDNKRLHFKQKEYWYTKEGVIAEANNRIRRIKEGLELFGENEI